jgi:hypothetical protein
MVPSPTLAELYQYILLPLQSSATDRGRLMEVIKTGFEPSRPKDLISFKYTADQISFWWT